VMYAGWLAEIGPTDAVLNPPQHPYTEALLSAVPLADPALPQRPRNMQRSDTVPSAGAAMGCPFQARCPRKLGTICETETPPIRVPQPGHALACHIPLAELRKVQPLLRTRSKKAVASCHPNAAPR
jgi:peptide/nickel transport system ATP-binding protein